MLWSKEKIIDRIYYFERDRDEARIYHAAFSPENIKNKHLKCSNIESPALLNALFNEAFGTLTKTEQYLLLNLYGKDSGLGLDNMPSKESLAKVMEETGMTQRGVDMKLFGTFRVLELYLNKEEK